MEPSARSLCKPTRTAFITCWIATSALSGATAALVWVRNRRRNLRQRFLLLPPSDPFHREDSVECSWRGIRLLRECAGARRAVEASEAGPSRLPGIWCSRLFPTAVSRPTAPTEVKGCWRSNLDCAGGWALRSLTCSTASNTFRSWVAKEDYRRHCSTRRHRPTPYQAGRPCYRGC